MRVTDSNLAMRRAIADALCSEVNLRRRGDPGVSEKKGEFVSLERQESLYGRDIFKMEDEEAESSINMSAAHRRNPRYRKSDKA